MDSNSGPFCENDRVGSPLLIRSSVLCQSGSSCFDKLCRKSRTMGIFCIILDGRQGGRSRRHDRREGRKRRVQDLEEEHAIFVRFGKIWCRFLVVKVTFNGLDLNFFQGDDSCLGVAELDGSVVAWRDQTRGQGLFHSSPHSWHTYFGRAEPSSYCLCPGVILMWTWILHCNCFYFHHLLFAYLAAQWGCSLWRWSIWNWSWGIWGLRNSLWKDRDWD